jgi:sulfopropanediol 3-dehydrogenase
MELSPHVLADLTGRYHGPESPAALVTTSETLAHQVVAEVERQLETLKTRDIAGPAWRDHGSVTVAADRDAAIELLDDLAPEHLEIITADDEYSYARLKNYGSVFIGEWSTVAYSDKGMGGANHVLPTRGGARHSAGLSVSRFLEPLTFQRATRAATPDLAEAVAVISDYEGLAAHQAAAVLRVDRFGA